jgi:ankyrin repeat protein
LANKANLESVTSDGVTALMIASQENMLDVINLLLENNALVNARAINGCPALSVAALRGNFFAVQALLNAGADRSLGHRNGELALMSAASNGHTGVCRLLLEDDGADLVNHKRDDGSTALLLAAAGGHHEVINMLLRKGADLYAVRVDGKSALDLAVVKRHVGAEKILRENLALGVIREKKLVKAVVKEEEYDDDEEE